MACIGRVGHSYRWNLLPFLKQTHHWGALKPAMDIKTFVFLDSETTGLPFYENNRTRMTELCFTAVQAEHIGLGVYPRIQSKVSLCFNPRKLINAEAVKITGLSNELLEHQPEFDAQACGIIQEFLNMQRRPICLVAHNGNRFDYPILRAEIHRSGNCLMDDVLCIDSLLAFRELYRQELEGSKENVQEVPVAVEEIPLEFQDGFDELLCSVLDDVEKSVVTQTPLTVEEIQKRNETTPQKQIIDSNGRNGKCNGNNAVSSVKRKLPMQAPSFKLGEVYKRLTLKEPTDAHRAETDVTMLVECVATLGQNFVDWANVNCIRFCDIPMMTPGKKFGT